MNNPVLLQSTWVHRKSLQVYTVTHLLVTQRAKDESPVTTVFGVRSDSNAILSTSLEDWYKHMISPLSKEFALDSRYYGHNSWRDKPSTNPAASVDGDESDHFMKVWTQILAHIFDKETFPWQSKDASDDGDDDDTCTEYAFIDFDNETDCDVNDKSSETPHDAVHQPSHYKLDGLDIEWIDVRSALLRSIPKGVPYEAVTSWSEAITYLARMWGKNGVEDAEKALFYITRLVQLLKTGKATKATEA